MLTYSDWQHRLNPPWFYDWTVSVNIKVLYSVFLIFFTSLFPLSFYSLYLTSLPPETLWGKIGEIDGGHGSVVWRVTTAAVFFFFFLNFLLLCFLITWLLVFKNGGCVRFLWSLCVSSQQSSVVQTPPQYFADQWKLASWLQGSFLW